MTTLLLTQQGEQAAQNVQGRGPEFTVLSKLYENSPTATEFEEVVEDLHTDEVKASMIVRRLINQGLVQEQ